MSALAFRPSSRAFALIVLLIAASVLGLAPILVRLTETGPAAAGFWRFLFALPLLTILASREPGGVGVPSKWALLAGGQALFLIAGVISHFAGSTLFRRV